MGIPLLRGRLFDGRDIEGKPRVVVISDAMARRFWPDQDPIGRRITFNSGIPPEQQQVVGGAGSREVVGVVGDVRHLELDESEVPTFYTPHAQQPSYHTMTLVVRAAQPAATLSGAVRASLREMDATVPLYQVRTLEQVLSRAVATPRLRAGAHRAVRAAVGITRGPRRVRRDQLSREREDPRVRNPHVARRDWRRRWPAGHRRSPASGGRRTAARRIECRCVSGVCCARSCTACQPRIHCPTLLLQRSCSPPPVPPR